MPITAQMREEIAAWFDKQAKDLHAKQMAKGYRASAASIRAGHSIDEGDQWLLTDALSFSQDSERDKIEGWISAIRG